MNPDARAAFFRQADWCERLGSPFTSLVCRALGAHLTEESAFGARLLNWHGDLAADATALRACGALNAMAREGNPSLAPLYPPKPLPSVDEFWRGIRSVITDEDARLSSFLDSAPQTNEVARSAALLPGYLEIARRTGLSLSIREIGASAGLNLLFDRYSYDYGSFSWSAHAAKVTIPCEWRGATPDLARSISVADRRGCDLNPIDAGNSVARARMLAYIWPDQTARLARAEAALEVASAEGVNIEAIDAGLFAARELQVGAAKRALVLVHSICWQYLPEVTRAAITAEIAGAAIRATRRSPFAWLRLEAESGLPHGAALRLSLWPDGPVDALIGVADFHGGWFERRDEV